MDTFEVAIEVAYVTIAAVKSDLFQWLRVPLHQLSRSGHS
jgi:hypothetical protein